MAIELRAGAGKTTRIKGDLNAMRLERDTYRAKYEAAIERARSAEAELEGMRYYNDVLECRLETAREEARNNLEAMGPECIRAFEELRNERDALRARIEDAPVIPASTEELYAVLDGMMSGHGYTPDDVKVACFDVQRTVDTLTGTTRKRVALVPLGDDE